MFLIEVFIKETKDKGFGAFTKYDIKKGTIIWEFVEGMDIKVHRDVVDNLNDVQKKFVDTYFWRENSYYFSSCDHSIFQNHSNNPNCIPLGDNQMIASRDILAGEELSTNYSHFDSDYVVYKDKLIE